MKTHLDKKQDSIQRTFDTQLQRNNSQPTFQFVDNRPETIAQRKLQKGMNNSPQNQEQQAIQKMADNSPQAQEAAQFQAMADSHAAEQPTLQKKENNTGLPDNLKSGIENLSGYSMDDVNVHYNSEKPAQLQAHAYAQGTDIHLGAGQEKHLPHEAWHVVQQKQGRVKPTMQMKGGVNVNDDKGLEKEADVMGEAYRFNSLSNGLVTSKTQNLNMPAQNKGAEPIQMIPYEKVSDDFTRLLEQKKKNDIIKKEIESLEDNWEDAENKDQKIIVRDSLKRIWDEEMPTEYPKKVTSAFHNYLKDLDDSINNLLKKLSIITELPKELNKDTIKIDFKDFNNLSNTLLNKDLPVNTKGFMTYVNEHVSHFSGIRNQLNDNPDILKKFWSGDSDNLNITFSSLGADDHGYAPPTKLDLTDNEMKKSLVYKSRPGEVDKLVTDLFIAINKKLPKGGGKLPEYLQETFKNGHLISEYIEGGDLADKIELMSGAGNHIKNLEEGPKRFGLDRNVKMLEAVSKAIGLTDLHEENLIHDKERNQLVPIDLESFSMGVPKETGLYGNKKTPDTSNLLPNSTSDDIWEFQDKLTDTKRRYVPVATGQLSNTLETDGVKATVDLITKNISKSGFNIKNNNLLKYIIFCKKNKPMLIPSFLIQKGIIFPSISRMKDLIIAEENGDIWTSENTVIPNGGIFEMEI